MQKPLAAALLFLPLPLPPGAHCTPRRVRRDDMSQAGVADSLAPSAGSTTAAGSKRKLHAEEVEAAAAAMPPAAGSDSISPAPKKARLAIQCMTVAERAALDASLASSRAANPNHGGERVCVRSAIEVDEAGLPVVHLDIFTPTAASRAALKEAKYQAQRAKFIEKKQGARARAKAAKAVARSEKEQFEAELVAAGKTKEEIIAAMRERWAQNNGGKASKRAGRHVQDAKRSLMTRMRAGQLQRVAVDCSFDHLMRVEEVCSLAKQIRHMYGHNVRSEQPLHLVLTSLGEATPGEKVEVDHFADLQKAMQEASTANASAVAATSTTVDAAEGAQATDDARASPSAASSATPATPVCTTRSVLQRMDGFDRLALDRTTAAYTDCFPRSSLVYLTAESPNVIDKLDPSKVYIIGGIVDHNRMKGLCHRLATEGDIPTARLPIPEFLVNDKRTVITVNQVFEILLRTQERPDADWASVFKSVLPARSNWQERQAASGDATNSASAAVDEADDDEAENEKRMDRDEAAEREEEQKGAAEMDETS